MPTRRDVLRGAVGVGALALAPSLAAARSSSRSATRATPYRQSVCRWPFSRIPDAEFYPQVRALGFEAVDLLTQAEWSIAADHGLRCSMGYPTARRDFIRRGLCHRANHALLLDELEQTLPAARQAGVPNVIAMIGNRDGVSDAEGLAATVAALERIRPLAEAEGVTICLELLNSKVDHADFLGDRVAFGLQVVQAVNSPRVRLLYDIYHMQIMEGDVIRTIRQHGAWIAHYHTAGNPGRHELDRDQELNYGAIARAIAETGFDGWLAHEFIPTRDPWTGLAEARQVCG